MCNKMSDVRLSNASPTLERVEARQPDAPRPPVRRNLFGTPDRDEVRRYFRDCTGEEARGFAKRWDYDPISDRPLPPRNYEWEEVSDAPEFYHRPPHDLQRPRRDAETAERLVEPGRNGSRKRATAAPGACSSDCKRSHTDRDNDADDDDEENGTAGQTAAPVEQKIVGLENRAHVQ